MLDFPPLVLFGTSFVGALVAGYLFAFLRRPRFAPASGARLRLAAPHGSFRSRIVEARGALWTIDAPLRRDAYVALRVGERLRVETPAKDGVWVGVAAVEARDAETHRFNLRLVAPLRRVERRSERRHPVNAEAMLNGVRVVLADLSASGARVVTQGGLPEPGERVLLDLPGKRDVFGYVVGLDRENAVARICFDA